MTRRVLIFGAFAIGLKADTAQEVWTFLADAAAALGQGNDVEFLHAFDPAMKGYETLRANVGALVRQVDIECAIEPVQSEGDDAGRTLELDWLLHLASRDGLSRVTRRRETVKCRVEKRKGKWRIVAFEPVSLFAPPRD
jgi:hypothetical protein